MPHSPQSGRPGRSRSKALAILAGTVLVAPVLTVLTPATPALAETDCATVAWMNTAKSPAQRADALLAASTLQQKYRWLVEQPANSPKVTTFSGVTYPVQVDCTPTVVYTDGPDGVRFTAGVTAFPSQLSLASTWNRSLARTKGVAQADESFDKGKNGVLAPGLANTRTPLSGRLPEYLGEDSVLGGVLAAQVIKGLQNPTGNRAVMADLKHYVANEQELDRQTSSSNVSERALREIYELPFEIAINQAQPSSVMCAYNQINGAYACENQRLTDVLKDDHGLEGYVLSDFGAVHSTAKALMTGLDQELEPAPVLHPGAPGCGADRRNHHSGPDR